jgi:hypothetical protein
MEERNNSVPTQATYGNSQMTATDVHEMIGRIIRDSAIVNNRRY